MNFFILLLSNVIEIPMIILLNFSFILFSIGLVGIVWNKQNFLILLVCIELMFFSISLNFIFFSVYLSNFLGQLFCLLIVTAAAAETAIGLSLLITASRVSDEVTYDSLVTLRG